jgi:hypothetical protein
MRRTLVLMVALAATGAAATGAELRKPGAFSGIKNDDERAAALFTEAGKVLTSPRCMNCHPAGDRPRQGDDRRLHQPLVVRGGSDLGATGMRCGTCHGPANFDPAHMPGHPQWHMAPASMAWEGKSLRQICEQIKTPAFNGGRDMVALLHHLSEDSLVGWAWLPGKGREPAPGTQAEFGALLDAWADAGAACPK